MYGWVATHCTYWRTFVLVSVPYFSAAVHFGPKKTSAVPQCRRCMTSMASPTHTHTHTKQLNQIFVPANPTTSAQSVREREKRFLSISLSFFSPQIPTVPIPPASQLINSTNTLTLPSIRPANHNIHISPHGKREEERGMYICDTFPSPATS